MNAVAAVLLQNAVIATVAAVFLLVILRVVDVPARVESLLWLAVAVRLILLPVFPVSLPLPFAEPSFSASHRNAEATAKDISSVSGTIVQAVKSPAASGSGGRLPTAETRPPPNGEVEPPRIGATADALLVLWLGGAIAFFIFRSVHIVRWTRRRSVAQAPPELGSMVAEVAEKLRVRPPRVEVDHDLTAPVVNGAVRPRLLWPARLLDTLEHDRARTLVAHELAHIRHRDLWAGLVELVVGSVWWWYPGWYFVHGRFRDASERACDARVVSLYPSLRRQYAEGLLDVAAIVSRPVPLTIPGFTGDRRHIARRLREILSTQSASWGPVSRPVAIIFVLLLAPAWMPLPPDVEDEPVTRETEREGARRGLADGVSDSAREHSAPVRFDATPVRSETADTVSESPEQDADLMRRLRSSNPDVRRRAVGTIGRERLLPLISEIFPLAYDSTELVRWQVAASIGLAEPVDGIATLTGLLSDDSPRVRASAAWALGEFEAHQLEKQEAVEPLIGRVHDSDRRVRRQVAASLAITGVEGWVPALLGGLEDESASVRATAVWGLGELRRMELTRRIVRLANDAHPAVRKNVARALYLLPAEEWRSVLEQLVDDPDPDVRGTATLALRQHNLESSESGD